jgi:hypothetical protein
VIPSLFVSAYYIKSSHISSSAFISAPSNIVFILCTCIVNDLREKDISLKETDENISEIDDEFIIRNNIRRKRIGGLKLA